MNALLSDRKALLKSHNVDNITSDLVLIQSSISLFNGTYIHPWTSCNTVFDVNNTIKTIRENPFIARFVTAQGAIALYQQLVLIGASDIIDVPTIFTQFNNLKPNKIREVVIEMLNVLVQYPDHITNICNIPIDLIDTKIDFTNFGTDMTLVGSNNPLNDVIKFFPNLPIKKCMDEIKKYNIAMNTYKLSCDKIRAQAERSDSKIDVTLALSKLEYPKLVLPQYNSYDVMPNYESIALLETNAPDLLRVLLLYGIVVYDTTLDKYDNVYMNTIIDLISSASVRYVFSASFAYGVNYPFTKIIILNEYIENNTMNTILQLTGRAGRVNKSTRSNIVIPNSFALRLLDYIKNPDTYNIEAHNIQKSYHTLQIRYNIQNLIDTLIIEEPVQVKKKYLKESKESESKESKINTILETASDMVEFVPESWEYVI
jgi:hypothetical protein